MNEKRIYLEFNASTPLAPEVVEAMRPLLTEHFGNPSTHHWAGAPAKAAVERARAQVAALLGETVLEAPDLARQPARAPRRELHRPRQEPRRRRR